MAHPKFILKNGKDSKTYFSLTAKNGQVILVSQGYKSMSACENGIKSVKTNSQDANRFERKESKNGQFYFNLKAGNGEVIGLSEQYKSKSSMENGINSVMSNAKLAEAEIASV